MLTTIHPTTIPLPVRELTTLADQAGFDLSCTTDTGSLLRVLAASKPGGRLLELGTGMGIGTAWLADGMTGGAHLTTVEHNPTLTLDARRLLANDPVKFITDDAADFLTTYRGPAFDLVFVDCRPGKFYDRDPLLTHLAPGALYIVDDLLPQPTWPADHQARVDLFLDQITSQPGLTITTLDHSSGLLLGTRS